MQYEPLGQNIVGGSVDHPHPQGPLSSSNSHIAREPTHRQAAPLCRCINASYKCFGPSSLPCTQSHAYL